MCGKIYILIPVYNEGRSIYDLLAKCEGFLVANRLFNHLILVINDCSTDNSGYWIREAIKTFRKLKIDYVEHDKNKGLHGSLSSGFYLLKDIKEQDLLITMDGDNTHNPFLIRAMLDKVNEGADIVIASRYCEESRVSGLSKLRIILSTGARYIYSMIWNIKGVKDYTCGYRAYKGWIVKESRNYYKDKLIEEKGFTATAEILKKFTKFNPTIVEIPMVLQYSNKVASSNMKVGKTIIQTLAMLIRRDRY